MSSGDTQTTAPNAQRLLWAGFMAILAAGVGYSVRGGILGQWAESVRLYHDGTGADHWGWPDWLWHVIILSSLIADKVGYGKLMTLAFLRTWSQPVDSGAPVQPLLPAEKPQRSVSVLGDVSVCDWERDLRSRCQSADCILFPKTKRTI